MAGREQLTQAIRASMHEHFGINVVVDLVEPGTLPRTSSGKLSRSLSRQGYFERLARTSAPRTASGASTRKSA